jgi:Cytochrome C oxidase, cbb3-type, subunit III
MKTQSVPKARILLTSGFSVFLAVVVGFLRPSSNALCDPPIYCYQTYAGCGEEPPGLEVGGTWYWLRSPEQEKRVVMALFNRYCIRCHGVDGRGVWDIPDVPNFANPRWQASRADGELARAILEGRGSVMPPFRGTLSLEEAWAIARYVRTFVPGTEMSRPDYGAPPAQGPSIPPGATIPPSAIPPSPSIPQAPPVRTQPAPAPRAGALWAPPAGLFGYSPR